MGIIEIVSAKYYKDVISGETVAINVVTKELDKDGNNWTAGVYGSQAVDTSDLSSFTAFADLTASNVQGWVETALGTDEVTAMKASLDANIAAKITPTSVTKTIGS